MVEVSKLISPEMLIEIEADAYVGGSAPKKATNTKKQKKRRVKR